MRLCSLIVLLCCGLFGCANHTRLPTAAAPTAIENENTLSILIPPPINNSTAADAPDVYLATLTEPLAKKGFYVIPVPLSDELFKREGITDGTPLKTQDLSIYQKHLGADAVLFITIYNWDTNYVLLAGNVTIRIGFELVSTKTQKTLWSRTDVVSRNTSGGNRSLVETLIATAINTALTDYIPLARELNTRNLNTLPDGPYLRHHKSLAEKNNAP